MKTEDAFNKLKISYVGNNFKEWFYPLKFDPKNKVKPLTSQKVPHAMNDIEILAELKPTEVSMEEIIATLETLDDSVWALFYCKDKNSVLRAVSVNWNSNDDGWYVHAYAVTNPGSWFDGGRVFSRQFLNAKTLGSSDPLTLEPLVARIKSLEEDMEKIKRLINI